MYSEATLWEQYAAMERAGAFFDAGGAALAGFAPEHAGFASLRDMLRSSDMRAVVRVNQWGAIHTGVGLPFDHSLGWHSEEGIIFRPPAPFPGVRPRPHPAPAAPAPANLQMPHVGCRARAVR